MICYIVDGVVLMEFFLLLDISLYLFFTECAASRGIDFEYINTAMQTETTMSIRKIMRLVDPVVLLRARALPKQQCYLTEILTARISPQYHRCCLGGAGLPRETSRRLLTNGISETLGSVWTRYLRAHTTPKLGPYRQPRYAYYRAYNIHRGLTEIIWSDECYVCPSL